jgi:hypothetical protein
LPGHEPPGFNVDANVPLSMLNVGTRIDGRIGRTSISLFIRISATTAEGLAPSRVLKISIARAIFVVFAGKQPE